jgi:hypothetical protein
VCGALSLLMNVTVDPRETVWGFGEYAVVVSAIAPATIESDGPPDDVFDVDGAVEKLQSGSSDRRSTETRLQALSKLRQLPGRQVPSFVLRSESSLPRTSFVSAVPAV